MVTKSSTRKRRASVACKPSRNESSDFSRGLELAQRLSFAQQSLNADELEVLCVIAERMARIGVKSYGHLDIDGDGRDFIEEANQEYLDATVYLAIETIRKTRKK